MEVNLLDHLDDESLWQESFWVLRDVVLKCITLNSYLKTFKKPQDIYVSHYDINPRGQGNDLTIDSRFPFYST